MLKWTEEENCAHNYADPDDAATVAEIRALVQDAVEAAAAAMRRRFFGPTSAFEAAMWAIKITEAKAFQASGLSADAPLLAQEATERGVTLNNLCNKVLNKAATVAAREAKISGVCGKHKDAIAALNTRAELLAYNWQDGFPGV